MYKTCVVLVLFLLLSSCGKDDAAPTTDVDALIQQYIDSLGLPAARDESGLYFYPITSNPTGTPVGSGNVIGIFYTLRDLNGNQIASYPRGSGDSLVMKQGVNAVFPVGLDLGLSFMRQGETTGFIIPPNLGYGQLEEAPFGPDVITVMEVEVAGVRSEADVFTDELTAINDYITNQNLNDTVANPVNRVQLTASGVGYKRTRVGNGTLPLNGDTVIINYNGRFLDNTSFGSRTEFVIIWGSDNPRPLIPGLSFGLSQMQTDERALIIIPSSQAYIESAQVVPGSIVGELIENSIIPDYVSTIPPYRTLVFDITRLD